MDNRIKRHVEYELKNYIKTRDKFKSILEDDSSGKFKVLITSNRLTYLNEILTAIERNLEALDPTQLKFIEMRYWKNKYNIQFIAQHLGCGVRTLHNWKSKLLEDIAEDMGWW
jgi:DNA-directed RNA polymerase specialized sigma24 family protein